MKRYKLILDCPKVWGRGLSGAYDYDFFIFYDKGYTKGYRHRVKAGCRDFTIAEACHHWLDPEHRLYKTRPKTLRKLFKKYKVEKRRIPKKYRAILGY